ncbi:zinc finger, C2H2 [Tanacetum coccineum]|uniref:Zinc finger, C2H2 n=1 Tax=Tanacetum coccineum TaxID=301880 RepID=A0ABQ5C5U5_9ASTR
MNRGMSDLKEHVHKIHPKSNKEFFREEVKSRRNGETKQDNQGFTLKTNLLATLRRIRTISQESCTRQNILAKWMHQFIENTNNNLKRYDSAIKDLERKVVRLADALAVQNECPMKLEPPRETPICEVETFTEKVKKCIIENQVNGEKLLKQLEIDFDIHIIEDDKVLIILGRPMLATAQARIDVFRGKISLEVGTEQVIFNANKGATPLTVAPVCVVKDYDVTDDLGGREDLEELLMNDDINQDLGDFLQDNNLVPNFDAPEVISLYPSRSPSINRNPFGEFQDSDGNLGIEIDDFVEGIDDL